MQMVEGFYSLTEAFLEYIFLEGILRLKFGKQRLVIGFNTDLRFLIFIDLPVSRQLLDWLLLIN